MININISRKVFNARYLPLLGDSHRYLVLYGGAGSGKSYFAAQRYIYKLISPGMCNLLVVRQVGRTNRDSTYSLLRQIITRWGLSDYYRCNDSDLRITCTATGNSAIFKGLDDAEKLKSVTFARGELTDIWVEEASEICEEDYKQLDTRLRGGKAPKQVTLTFNPIDINHWLKHRYFDRPDERAVTLHTTYKDNAHIDAEYAALLEGYKDTDPYYYTVYCLGEWGVYGKTVFAAAAVSGRLSELRGAPYRTGLYEYDYDGMVISNIRWVDDASGYIKLYCEPEQGRPYVIGGDTAGDGSDYFVGQVLDNVTGQQVATLRHDTDEDLYARQMYCLGKSYNDALLAIEANYSTYPIKELERLGYNHQYVRVSEDTYTHKPTKSYGYQTNSKTRPLSIAGLVTIAREHIEYINDTDTLEEMLTFVRNSKGRPEAQQGAHDDCVMALAIAYYAREQQLSEVAPEERKTVKWLASMIDDYERADTDEREWMIAKYGYPSNM